MANASSTIGIDLGGTKALFICGDAEERSTTGSKFSPRELTDRLRSFVQTHSLRPTAIGIAVPGLVGLAGEIAACDVLPELAGWDATKELSEFGANVVVVNDVKAALAEEMHDAGPRETVGVIMAGTAIGAAFIAEGRPLIGAGGFAGELGYLPLLTGSEGDAKRLDELAGGEFIASSLGLSAHQLSERARQGDASVLEAIRRGGHALGLGLAAVINLLNPSRLAVGGGALSLPGYWNAARETAAKMSLPDCWRLCSLTEVRAGARVVALGAIRVAETNENPRTVSTT